MSWKDLKRSVEQAFTILDVDHSLFKNLSTEGNTSYKDIVGVFRRLGSFRTVKASYLIQHGLDNKVIAEAVRHCLLSTEDNTSYKDIFGVFSDLGSLGVKASDLTQHGLDNKVIAEAVRHCLLSTEDNTSYKDIVVSVFSGLGSLGVKASDLTQHGLDNEVIAEAVRHCFTKTGSDGRPYAVGPIELGKALNGLVNMGVRAPELCECIPDLSSKVIDPVASECLKETKESKDAKSADSILRGLARIGVASQIDKVPVAPKAMIDSYLRYKSEWKAHKERKRGRKKIEKLNEYIKYYTDVYCYTDFSHDPVVGNFRKYTKVDKILEDLVDIERIMHTGGMHTVLTLSIKNEEFNNIAKACIEVEKGEKLFYNDDHKPLELIIRYNNLELFQILVADGGPYEFNKFKVLEKLIDPDEHGDMKKHCNKDVRKKMLEHLLELDNEIWKKLKQNEDDLRLSAEEQGSEYLLEEALEYADREEAKYLSRTEEERNELDYYSEAIQIFKVAEAEPGEGKHVLPKNTSGASAKQVRRGNDPNLSRTEEERNELDHYLNPIQRFGRAFKTVVKSKAPQEDADIRRTLEVLGVESEPGEGEHVLPKNPSGASAKEVRRGNDPIIR